MSGTTDGEWSVGIDCKVLFTPIRRICPLPSPSLSILVPLLQLKISPALPRSRAFLVIDIIRPSSGLFLR